MARRPSAGRIDGASVVGRLGAYANDAVLPFYVLHETVIVVIAYYVLPWKIGALAQFLLISLTSLAATLLLYDLGIRRTPITRFLFGLRPNPPARSTPAEPTPTKAASSKSLGRTPTITSRPM